MSSTEAQQSPCETYLNPLDLDFYFWISTKLHKLIDISPRKYFFPTRSMNYSLGDEWKWKQPISQCLIKKIFGSAPEWNGFFCPCLVLPSSFHVERWSVIFNHNPPDKQTNQPSSCVVCGAASTIHCSRPASRTFSINWHWFPQTHWPFFPKVAD